MLSDKYKNIKKMLVKEDYQAVFTSLEGDNSDFYRYFYLLALIKINPTNKNIADYKDYINKSNLNITDREASVIYDSILNDNESNEYKVDISEEFKKNYLKEKIDVEDSLTKTEIEELVEKVKIPVKEEKKYNLRGRVGIFLLIVAAILLAILIPLIYTLPKKEVYYTAILILILPVLLVVIGLNNLLFVKNHYLLMILMAFSLLYIVSLLVLIPYIEEKNLLKVIANHFIEMLKALYNFVVNDAFKNLE